MVLITELSKDSNPFSCEGVLLEKSKNSLLVCVKAMPKNLEEVKWV